MLRKVAGRMYRGVRARVPQAWAARLAYLRAHGRLPDVRTPGRLSDHLFVQKLRGDQPAFAERADKLRVKAIVAKTLGPSFVTPTLWHGPSLPPREERTWPMPFVLKANHGSAMNAFVRSEADLDWDALERAAERWLRTDWPRWMAEDWYNRIERQLLVEPLLDDGTGDLPDYKVLVFFGQAQFVQVDAHRGTDRHARAYYDLSWERQPFWVGIPLRAEPHPRPVHLTEMIRAAEALSVGFDFVRVDFYDLPDGPRFGEMTFSPGSALDVIRPDEADLALGRLWDKRRAAVKGKRVGDEGARQGGGETATA